jgi:hypothetical protein
MFLFFRITFDAPKAQKGLAPFWNYHEKLHKFLSDIIIITTRQKKVDKLEQQALKNVDNCLNTNIYSYLETSGGQSSNLYLNVVHFFNAS